MVATPVDDEQLRRVAAAVAAAQGIVAHAARALNQPYATVLRHYRMAERLGMTATQVIHPSPVRRNYLPLVPPPPPPAPPDRSERLEIAALKREVASLERVIAEGDAVQAENDRFRSLAEALRDRGMPPPDWAIRVPASDSAPGVPMLFLSDWHIGETVDPAQMHNAASFNEQVAEERAKRLVDRVLRLAFHHIKHPKYEGIVVMLGGDFVSGWLHEELFRTDWASPVETANWCVSRLYRILDRLAHAFTRVHVVCVPGNHGRMTKKPMMKGGSTSCFDHGIYLALADRFEADLRLTFDIPATGEALFEVAGTRYLLMHGHELGVKGGDGLIGALGPIMRGAIKTGRAERSLGRDFDILLLAHYHQPIWQPASGIIVNGAFKGYDEYARKQRYAFTPPTQWLWFSHPVFGPNIPHDVRLQDPIRANKATTLFSMEADDA